MHPNMKLRSATDVNRFVWDWEEKLAYQEAKTLINVIGPVLTGDIRFDICVVDSIALYY